MQIFGDGPQTFRIGGVKVTFQERISATVSTFYPQNFTINKTAQQAAATASNCSNGGCRQSAVSAVISLGCVSDAVFTPWISSLCRSSFSCVKFKTPPQWKNLRSSLSMRSCCLKTSQLYLVARGESGGENALNTQDSSLSASLRSLYRNSVDTASGLKAP